MILDEINKFISHDEINEVELMARFVKIFMEKLNKNSFDIDVYHEMVKWFNEDKIKSNIHLILWKSGIEGDEEIIKNFK